MLISASWFRHYCFFIFSSTSLLLELSHPLFCCCLCQAPRPRVVSEMFSAISAISFCSRSVYALISFIVLSISVVSAKEVFFKQEPICGNLLSDSHSKGVQCSGMYFNLISDRKTYVFNGESYRQVASITAIYKRAVRNYINRQPCSVYWGREQWGSNVLSIYFSRSVKFLKEVKKTSSEAKKRVP